MHSLINPEPSTISSISSIHTKQPRHLTLSKNQTTLSFSSKYPHRSFHGRIRLTARAVLDSATLDQLGLLESDIRNPSLSSSHRSPKIPKPNQTVLEAQARVCAGPTQTKPLGEEQAFKALDTILKSAKGELKDEEQVSNAQLGAFFAAMTIRANAFPEATQWSEGERHAMNTFWPLLVRALPPDVIFLADPEGSIMGVGSSIGPQYVGNGFNEMRLVGALREVLAGGHLGYEETGGSRCFERGSSTKVERYEFSKCEQGIAFSIFNWSTHEQGN